MLFSINRTCPLWVISGPSASYQSNVRFGVQSGHTSIGGLIAAREWISQIKAGQIRGTTQHEKFGHT
jgi:hypothetical protein